MLRLKNKKLCESCFSVITSEPCKNCGFSKKTYTPAFGVLPAGSVLAKKYTVGGVIGQGGFGITYRAYDKTNDKIFAIKEYYPNTMVIRNTNRLTVSASSERNEIIFKKGIREFYEEAGLVSKFNGNPNIVSIYDCFYENETAYLVMEFIKGETLKSYVKKNGVLSSAQALYVFSEMSNALMICHSTGLLHRDISPDNIMLCENGKLKLIDFGAAREVADDDPKSLSVILKNGFAPLEQYQKHGKQGAWTDIYSLGATVYYLLTKETLDDPMSRLENDGELENSYGIDEELWKIIVNCVKLKISERYQNAFELKEALKSVSCKSVSIIGYNAKDKNKSNDISKNNFREDDKTVYSSRSNLVNDDKTAFSPENNLRDDDKTIFSSKSNLDEDDETEYIGNDVYYIDNDLNKSNSDNEKSKKEKGFYIKFAAIAASIIGVIVIGAVALNNVRIVDTESENITVTQEETTAEETTVKETTAKETTVKETTVKETTTNETTTSANICRITFEDENNEEIVKYNIELGKTILSSKIPDVPEKAGYSGVWVYGDDNTKFTVNTIIKDNLIVKPMYTIQCTVTFTDKNGNVYETATVVSGEKVSFLPDVPEYPNFDGIWVIDGGDDVEFTKNTAVSDNITVKPEYTKVKIGDKYYKRSRTDLVLSNLKLNDSDIKNLKYMTNLESLDLTGNNLSDLSCLSGLTKLTFLSIKNNNVSDISFMKNMTKLERFQADSNSISDLSPLSGLTKLNEVYLSTNKIKDISALSKLKKLTTLCINQNSISDVSPLANGQVFKTLQIQNNSYKDKDTYLSSFADVTMANNGEFYINDQNPGFSEEDIIEVIRNMNCDGSFNYWY